METKGEFIQRFNEVFTDEVISDYLNANLEDTDIDMNGVYIGGIWFTSICTDNTCNTTETWIFGVNGYCSIRRTPLWRQIRRLHYLPCRIIQVKVLYTELIKWNLMKTREV